MIAKRHLIVPLAAALAAAGCGSSSSSSSSTPKAASQASTSMTHTSTSMSMSETSTSMAMGHVKGMTVASMVQKMAMPAHAELTVASSPHYGKVVYDKDHFALYVFSADHGSSSTCYGACSSAHGGWPPLLTKGAPRVAGLNSSLLGTTKRQDGSLQVTYAGHPLYYWSGDTAHTISCQHVSLHGGFWYVVNPDGTPNTAKGVDTMSAMG
jgi:predicted lipoprotein with Yx(FWY)xxD motif